MTNEMPKDGKQSLEMMYRTCGIQINYDYTSESNFEKIFRLGNYLTPLTIALYSNSPFVSGKPTGYYSYRNKVWQNTSRGGIMPIAFEKMTFENHIEDIVTRANKRLNLLKAIRGQKWGASPETLLYTYRTYVRPILEYGCILYSHEKENLLKKIQAIEVKAIKIAFRLPPWATNTWCYNLINFDKILDRLKKQAKSFLTKHSSDHLMKLRPHRLGNTPQYLKI